MESKADPFDFKVSNVKNDEELLNINSVDGIRVNYTALEEDVELMSKASKPELATVEVQ